MVLLCGKWYKRSTDLVQCGMSWQPQNLKTLGVQKYQTLGGCGVVVVVVVYIGGREENLSGGCRNI